MQIIYNFDPDKMEMKTEKLDSLGLNDFRIKLKHQELVESAKAFIEFLVEYQIECKEKISHNQTLTYGFWMVKFNENDKYLEVQELNRNASTFVNGLELTLNFWSEQMYICTELDSDFDPPTADKLVTVSPNIFHDDNLLNGVRYPEEENHSGWMFYSNENDLNQNDFIQMHLYELVVKKPDIACFFGLPEGYRLLIENEDYDAWFEEENLIK